MPAAAPTTSDLQTFLTASGLYDASLSGQLAAALASAQGYLETIAGVTPFVAGATATALLHDPGPDSLFWTARQGGVRRLELQAPAVEVTEVKVGVDKDGNNGTTLVANEGYWTEPRNAATRGRAIRAIELWVPISGQPMSIKVTARWGLRSSWPDDVWLALMQYAATEVLGPAIVMAKTGGLESWKEGDIEEKNMGAGGYFGSESVLGTLRASWQRVFNQYREVSF